MNPGLLAETDSLSARTFAPETDPNRPNPAHGEGQTTARCARPTPAAPAVRGGTSRLAGLCPASARSTDEHPRRPNVELRAVREPPR